MEFNGIQWIENKCRHERGWFVTKTRKGIAHFRGSEKDFCPVVDSIANYIQHQKKKILENNELNDIQKLINC